MVRDLGAGGRWLRDSGSVGTREDRWRRSGDFISRRDGRGNNESSCRSRDGRGAVDGGRSGDCDHRRIGAAADQVSLVHLV